MLTLHLLHHVHLASRSSAQLAYSLFAITGDQTHRELAQMFYKSEWMDALAVCRRVRVCFMLGKLSWCRDHAQYPHLCRPVPQTRCRAVTPTSTCRPLWAPHEASRSWQPIKRARKQTSLKLHVVIGCSEIMPRLQTAPHWPTLPRTSTVF